MWFKKNLRKIIIALVIVAALAAAFFFGGSSPSSEGSDAANAETASSTVEPTAETTADPTAEPTAEPTVSPTDEPEDTAETTPSPSPSPTPTAEVTAAPATEAPATPAPTEAPKELQCTISISCATVLNNTDLCSSATLSLIPSGGAVLGATTVTFEEGESVFDVLKRVCRDNGIHLEFTTTPGTGGVYIEGIANLYEFDVGELSGWMYSVNGVFANYSCSQYTLKDGDVIRWSYTCDLGNDL